MALSQWTLDSPLRHIVCGAALAALIASVTVVVIRTFAHTLARNADTLEAAEFAADASPNDPLTRYRRAAFLERSFDLRAIPISLAEFEAAAGLSPHNFLYWLALGQARERDGDRPAAEAAYRRAVELAPHYARTQWALGNNLIRQGNTHDGIDLIRSAVQQDETFASPAVIAAMQAFDSDVARVSTAFGQSASAMSELSKYLSNEGRYEEALIAWRRIPPEFKAGNLKETATAIRAKFIAAKRYRDAAEVTGSIIPEEARQPRVGEIINGGFESTVPTQNADVFDWHLGETYPLFGLSDDQPKEGRYSLLMRFGSPTRLDFATVRRTVAVEPRSNYQLSLSYRSDLQTRAVFRWEIVTADGARSLAVSEPLGSAVGWSEIVMRFTAPEDIDGVTLRLIRENCNSAVCTVAGNLWFDDFRLARS